ncbi:MAG: CaiB/BaiF CoA transferase family protein, partial [Pseudomonadota bacterium]
MTGFGALQGLEVIDLTRVLGGPYCTQVLADHGANVIKIEPPQGDEVRDWGPPFDEHGNASYFLGVNRNKRSLGLDLATEAGRDVLLRLLANADVLIENFKPGSMEKWGLGYEQVLKERFPRLIHARISGFGGDGPYGGLPGYDAIIQAMAGHFSVNGDANSGPTRIGIPLVDMGTGLYTAVAILMALLERQRSGLGQYLDMTLYDCGVALMFPHIPNYVLSGKVPGLTGNAHPNICPYDKFETANGAIFVAVGNNRAFARFTETIGLADLVADPRFASNGDRLTHKAELTALLEARLADVDGHALCTELLAKGVPAGPVQTTAEVWDDPHTHHRDMAV